MSKCHQELLLELNADCAEFCTVPEHHQWLAVGTYQLNETSSTRLGRLYLYSLQPWQQQQQQQQCHPQLQQLATLDVPGIFDLQWAHTPSVAAAPCMGLALADGTLRLVTVQPASAGTAQQQQQQQSLVKQDEQQQMQPAAAAVLQEACSCQAVASGMALALDWSYQQQQDQQQQQQQQQRQQRQLLVAVSSSAGTISIVQVGCFLLTQQQAFASDGLMPGACWHALLCM
jgi:hypothetical protein